MMIGCDALGCSCPGCCCCCCGKHVMAEHSIILRPTVMRCSCFHAPSTPMPMPMIQLLSVSTSVRDTSVICRSRTRRVQPHNHGAIRASRHHVALVSTNQHRQRCRRAIVALQSLLNRPLHTHTRRWYSRFDQRRPTAASTLHERLAIIPSECTTPSLRRNAKRSPRRQKHTTRAASR